MRQHPQADFSPLPPSNYAAFLTVLIPIRNRHSKPLSKPHESRMSIPNNVLQRFSRNPPAGALFAGWFCSEPRSKGIPQCIEDWSYWPRIALHQVYVF